MDSKNKKTGKCGFGVPTVRGGVFEPGSIKSIKQGKVITKDTKKKPKK